MSFTLPNMPYPYDAMEPYFDETTMRIHHTKHHQTYLDNTNLALKDLPELNNISIEKLIQQIQFAPKEKQPILRNNAGGHINHSLFWPLLKKNTILEGTLKKNIENTFQNVENFKKQFEICALNRFGSGWIWLIKYNNTLKISSTANQDNPLMGEKISGIDYGYPIIGLDVWEHAYYLKYQNRRLDYIKAFWHIINWEEASKRFNNSII